MPTWVTKIGGTGTTMTQDEIDNNILCIYGALSQYGWSKQAIAGACGCFHEESVFNPGIYESSHGGTLDNLPFFPGGMGLGQWTDYPAYAGEYPNPLAYHAQQEGREWYSGSFQCWLLTKADDSDYTSMGYGEGPRWGWQTSSLYPSIPFSQYTTATNYTIREMVSYWFYDLEWHSPEIADWVDFEARVRWGQYAYDLIEGRDPIPPDDFVPADGSITGFINWCITKCNEPNIGYSQDYRNEQTIDGITYYDCSSFVWYGLLHGGEFDVVTAHGGDAWPFTTLDLGGVLMALGFYEVALTSAWKQGDIVVSETHTEVVHTPGENPGSGYCMGAHSPDLPLADQVSINDYLYYAAQFDKMYRFPDQPAPQPKKRRMPIWMYLKRL